MKKEVHPKYLGANWLKKRLPKNFWEQSGGKKGSSKTFGNELVEKGSLSKLLGTTSRKKKCFQNFWKRPYGKKNFPKRFGNELVEKKLPQNDLGTNW